MGIAVYEKEEVYNKTYGIKEVYIKGRKRYLVVCDGMPTNDLHYAKADFAMRKAEEFCKQCYRDWTRDNGSRVHFTFTIA